MQKAYALPQNLRSKLARPLGRFFTTEEVKGRGFADMVLMAKMVVTVGDKVTDTIFALGRTPDVQVVDGKERRKKRVLPKVPYSRLVQVRNPAGVLTAQTIRGVEATFSGRMPARILVEGEEDLVAIPAIAFAPVTAVVFYGQPGEGIVAVRADTRAKARNKRILAQMGITELG